MHLGLIVNPVAGLGGRLGLKGTDGPEVARLALRMGAEPVSAPRTARALTELRSCRDRMSILAAPREMGADLARSYGFETSEPEWPYESATTTSLDTRAAAKAMEQQGVRLIVYAGGDGTTRDITDAVGTRVAILGIPAGVKMHSGTYATSPEAAAHIAAAYLLADDAEDREVEVLDVDESDRRSGYVSPRLYGLARVPLDRIRVQHTKASSSSADAALDALCRRIAIRLSGLTVFGPGTTTQKVLTYAGVEGTLLGVDVLDGRTLIGRDLNEQQLLDILEGRTARLVVSVVGGQGFVFGRGNQQLSPAVIRKIGIENLDIIASLEKIVFLDPPRLYVDTGDPDLDRELCGFRRVRVSPTRSVIASIST